MTTDRELADAIRLVAVRHHQASVEDETRTEATDHLLAAADILAEGEPRLRWYEVDSPQAGASRARNRELSAWSGALNVAAPPMTMELAQRDDGTPVMRGRVRLDRLREGPPKSAHGGVVAGLFDEILSAAQRLDGRPGGVTGRLVVRYRSRTPIDEELEFEAWIHDDRLRRITVRAHCRAGGEITAEAEGLFVRAQPGRPSDE